MQGKRKDQIEFSTRAVMISIIGIFVLVLTMLITNTNSKPSDLKGSPHNYWVPSDTIENVGNDSLIEDCEHSIYEDEDVMWIGNNGDTIWE
tara:strand:- start:2920 stop:3192 length:273 start_codon:yes stop_codon:yes gene_type:complete